MPPFLTARWTNLILLTWSIPESTLAPLLPRGLEPDIIRGSARVSLVAFDFLDTRVLGIGWPGFVNFPEINLRFYVRSGKRRGVMFVRELVPSRMVSAVARWTYNEPYDAATMASSVRVRDGRRRVRHRFLYRGTRNEIALIAKEKPFVPTPDSIEHALKEHEWGFGRDRRGNPLVYRVEHPVWRAFPVESANVSVDFARVYGHAWSDLRHRAPDHAMLAEGSRVRVFPHGAGG